MLVMCSPRARMEAPRYGVRLGTRFFVLPVRAWRHRTPTGRPAPSLGFSRARMEAPEVIRLVAERVNVLPVRAWRHRRIAQGLEALPLN